MGGVWNNLFRSTIEKFVILQCCRISCMFLLFYIIPNKTKEDICRGAIYLWIQGWFSMRWLSMENLIKHQVFTFIQNISLRMLSASFEGVSFDLMHGCETKTRVYAVWRIGIEYQPIN